MIIIWRSLLQRRWSRLVQQQQRHHNNSVSTTTASPQQQASQSELRTVQQQYALESQIAAASLAPSPPDPSIRASANSANSERIIAESAADVFRHCMSGSVGAVRKWLQQGGHADTVYQARADDISAI